MIDTETPEIEQKFVVKKWPVIICMLMNMVLFSLPWFWYQKEVAINDAYGRENLDSFNLIGESTASLYLPLVLGVPLSLLYLKCLKRIESKSTIYMIAFVPIGPWLFANALMTIMTCGFMLLYMIPCTILNLAILLYSFLNVKWLIYCSWDGSKKLSIEFLIVGYIVVFSIGVLMTTPMFLIE